MFVKSLFPCVLSALAIIPLGNRQLVGLLLLCSECRVAVVVLCLFLAMPWVGLWRVTVAFPSHTHLLLEWTAA